MAAVLEVKGVHKSYKGHTVLKGVSFSVSPGEVFGLLGPNGAGKSTMLGILSGLFPKDKGEVLYHDKKIETLAGELPKFIGIVPQDDYFYFPFTVEGNLRFFGLMNGVTGNELSKQVSHLISWLGLEPFRHTPAAQLSGGYKRLLNIACSLVHDPAIIFFDEPTVALDPNIRHLFWKKITELRKQGKAIILTTHYMDEAQKLCDRLCLIVHGEILAEGPPQELIDRFGGERILALRFAPEVDLNKEPRLLEGVHKLFPKSGIQYKRHYLFVSMPQKAQFDTVAKIVSFVESEGFTIVSQQLKEPELEDVFIHVTGERHLQSEVKNVAESKQ